MATGRTLLPWIIFTWMLGLTACVTSPKPDVVTLPAAVEEPRELDFNQVMGMRSSQSLFDGRVLEPDIMARIQVEQTFLELGDLQTSVEPWTRQMMLSELGRRGSLVIAPALDDGGSPTPAGPDGTAEQTAPTVAFRQVTFNSGTDVVPVVVELADDGSYLIAMRGAEDEPSLCPDDFSLTVGYVQLQGLVLRLPDLAVAAVIDETVLLTGSSALATTGPLPDPAADAARFCQGIQRTFVEHDHFRRTPSRYYLTAQFVLDMELSFLYQDSTNSDPDRFPLYDITER